jgi:hypothetical protein
MDYQSEAKVALYYYYPAACRRTTPTKKASLGTITVKVLQHAASSPCPQPKPFPIRIENKLPAITIDLGTSPVCSTISLP